MSQFIEEVKNDPAVKALVTQLRGTLSGINMEALLNEAIAKGEAQINNPTARLVTSFVVEYLINALIDHESSYQPHRQSGVIFKKFVHLFAHHADPVPTSLN